MKRLGIYGGTFNPIHVGHIRAAEAFYDAMRLDELLVMPTFISPHKEMQKGDDPSYRLEMTALAFEGNGRSITVSAPLPDDFTALCEKLIWSSDDE